MAEDGDPELDNMDLPPPPAAPGGADKPAASKELPPTPGQKKALPTPPTPAGGGSDKKALPALPPTKGAASDAKDTKSAPTTDSAAGAGTAAAADVKQFIGYCLCKKVKVTCDGLPTFSGFCHCTICSKHGGTDRGLIAGWPKAKVTIEGKAVCESLSRTHSLTVYNLTIDVSYAYGFD